MHEEMRIFLGIGSNVGDRYSYMKQAIQQLDGHPHIWVVDRSHVYQSSPMYYTDQNDYYNMVVEIDTNLTPIDLLNEIKSIEKKVGRKPSIEKNRPREIDIDILSFGNMEIHSHVLEVPHPGISERKFVLKPWNDLAPEYICPGFDSNIETMLDALENEEPVRMVLILDKEGTA